MKKVKRYTLRTIAGLEDALAIAIDIIAENRIHQLYLESRIRQLHRALQELRAGPDNYDPDKPAGQRIERDNS